MSWLFICAYLGLQFFIGYWVSRRIKTESDYLLGGRSVPLSLISFSLFATWFGAESCIGTSSAVYQEGISGGRADPFGYSVCLFLMGFLFAVRLWQGGYITLSDFFKERYGPFVEKLTVWILVPASIFWAAAQVRAFGQIISVTTTVSFDSAVFIAAMIIVLYTFFGGLLGDIIHDFFQGIIIAIGLAALLYVVLTNTENPWETIKTMDPARLSFLSGDETFLERLDRWMVPILGSLVAQELVSRVFAAKSAKVAKTACFVAGGIYLFLGSFPVIVGLLGPSLIPNLNDPEQFVILLAEKYLSPVLFIIFSGALVAAILSTVDSILLGAGALVSHNLIVPLLKIDSQKVRLFSARTTVMVAAIVSFAIAISGYEIYELVEISSSLGSAGILVITLMGLFTPFRHQAAAVAALIAGVVITPLAEHVFEWQAPFISAIVGAVIAFLVVQFATKRIFVPAPAVKS